MIGRFKAAGWTTDSCDGHDAADVYRALTAAQTSERPVMIACRTTIGFGLPSEGTQKAHADAPGRRCDRRRAQDPGLELSAFRGAGRSLNQWRAIGREAAPLRSAWTRAQRRHRPNARISMPPSRARCRRRWRRRWSALKEKMLGEKPAGTRKYSEKVLDVINGELATTIGGSADLTPSNNTKTKNITEIAPGDFAGRYIHYGIREHGMAAAMNGMALHGGVIPYGGTFMVFSDYCRPSIRLAALMGIRVVFVMTHDSIGVGEDGPTHQPIEHLAALRAIPGLLVMRPADAVETAECWQIALETAIVPA